MEDFGTIVLQNDVKETQKIYVGVLNGELMIDENYFDHADGSITIQYHGPYAGSDEELKQWIRQRIKSYLIDSGKLRRTGENLAGFPYYELKRSDSK